MLGAVNPVPAMGNSQWQPTASYRMFSNLFGQPLGKKKKKNIKNLKNSITK